VALTLLSDVIVPAVFNRYVQVLTAQNSAFVASGVIQENPAFDALLAGGGKTFDLPFFKDLDDTESNVSSDQGSDATVSNITTGRETAIRQNRNRAWGAADLVEALAGEDIMGAIATRVADYWVRQLERFVIASTQGVVADNIANDSGDMVVNKCIGAAGTPLDQHKFSAEAVIDALQTMGDARESLVAVAMHSVILTRAEKLNLIDSVPDSEGRIAFKTFLGRRVIVDDTLPAVVNGSNVEYSVYLYGAGAFAKGNGSPRVPVEVYRLPLAAAGGGTESLISRVEWLVHPRGFRFTSGSLAGQSPTITEMKAAANWDRVFPERKQVRLAELRVNP